ncbi:F-box/FBD/LRR-repeat protein At1g13570-like [Corylus avellana]|uniref:F-box/FBD/LRR-repeat protein At1g13570-like n=1 Tax=Corylus avellana TaxID=13451 RepID=UPI00286ABD62|nr:F-box/FBD/LRR-repeat protein At1g13570-like [Corylus avellana]XP_059437311.1 F-box/FBD/LRR-repeat protein At1g13570-like [Corylus avellana]
MIMKRKLEEVRPQGSVNCIPKYCFGFSVPEIDKIVLDRLPTNQISRLKWPQFQSKTLLGIDSAPEADLTGRLPEDILSSIISLISVREAATTSILSKRWRYLWTTSSNLDLDPKNMLGHFLCLEHFQRQHTQWKQKQKGRFVGWANHILELYAGKKVDSFRVEYPLGSDHGCDVDRWIQFAIDMQVQNLSINLLECNLSDLSRGLYKFPYWLFDQAGKQSKIKHLSLNFCSLSIPANFNGLNSLSSLSLTKTSLSQENLDNILNGCPSLEWFSMSECRCPFHLKLSSGCRFLRLRHLRIVRCDPLEKVEIHDAISIASIEYDAKMFGQVLLKNSAQPVRICTTLGRGTLQRDHLNLQSDPRTQMTYILGTVAKDYPLLEILLVYTPMVKIDIIPKHLTTFTRLKQLKLLGVTFREILLDLTSAFLEAAPSLVELQIDLFFPCTDEGKIEHQKIVDGADYTEHRKIPLKEYCQHQRLKEVKLSGFRGYPIEFDLAVLLLKNALLLEKMRIVRETTLYLGDGECWVLKLNKDGIKQEQILKILGPEVPSTVNLVLE